MPSVNVTRDSLETNKEIALSKSNFTDDCLVGGGGGEVLKFVSPTKQTSVKFCDFVEQYNFACIQHTTFKLGKFPNFKVLFPAMLLHIR